MKTLGQVAMEARENAWTRLHFMDVRSIPPDEAIATQAWEAAAQAVVAEADRRAWREISEADTAKPILIRWENEWRIAKWVEPIFASKIKPHWMWSGGGCREWKRKHQPTHFRPLPAPPEVQG